MALALTVVLGTAPGVAASAAIPTDASTADEPALPCPGGSLGTYCDRAVTTVNDVCRELFGQGCVY